MKEPLSFMSYKLEKITMKMLPLYVRIIRPTRKETQSIYIPSDRTIAIYYDIIILYTLIYAY